MKKFLALMFATMFLLAGCGSNSNSNTKSESPAAEQNASAPKKSPWQEQAATEAEAAAAERDAFQNWESKINSGVAAVDDHWETLWQYTLTDAANGAIAPQTAFQNFRELEHKLIDDEMIFHNATVPQEMSGAHATKMNTIKQGFENWAKLRRKASENFRIALGSGNVTPQVMQESVDIINKADALMLRSTAELMELENEINR